MRMPLSDHPAFSVQRCCVDRSVRAGLQASRPDCGRLPGGDGWPTSRCQGDRTGGGSRWSAQPDAFELAPGASQSVSLTFSGSDRVEKKVLKLLSNDPDEPKARVALRIGGRNLFVGDTAPDVSVEPINAPGPWRL